MDISKEKYEYKELKALKIVNITTENASYHL